MEDILIISSILIIVAVFILWYGKKSKDKHKKLMYLKNKSLIIELLEKIKNHFNRYNIIDNAIKKINDEKTTITVVGHWNHGKSTFINALLKEKLFSFPTKILTKVEYSNSYSLELIQNNQESNIIKYKDLNSLIIGLNDFENKSNLTYYKYKELIVRMKNSFLKNNFRLIDTPGYNKSKNKINAIIPFVKHSDLIIYIFDSSIYGNFEDFQIIKKINKHCKRDILFIINSWDKIVDDIEKEGILKDLKEKLETNSQYIDPLILPASSLYELYGQRLKKYKNKILKEPESEKISFYDKKKKHRYLESINDSYYLLKNNGFDEIKKQIKLFIEGHQDLDNKIDYWKTIIDKLISIIKSKNISNFILNKFLKKINSIE